MIEQCSIECIVHAHPYRAFSNRIMSTPDRCIYIAYTIISSARLAGIDVIYLSIYEYEHMWCQLLTPARIGGMSH